MAYIVSINDKSGVGYGIKHLSYMISIDWSAAVSGALSGWSLNMLEMMEMITTNDNKCHFNH